VAVRQCSEDVLQFSKCLSGGAATLRFDISPDFPYYKSGTYGTNGTTEAWYWVKAVGYKKSPCYVSGGASMGPAFGTAGFMDLDCTANLKPGWTVLSFAP
jgi:hypothetical protein